MSLKNFVVWKNGFNVDMEWKYNLAKEAHELLDQGAVLAKICLKHKEGTKYPFRSKALLSFLYVSQKKQKTMSRKKREWIVKKREFQKEEERNAYIEEKKKDLLKRIQIQETL